MKEKLKKGERVSRKESKKKNKTLLKPVSYSAGL